MTLVVCSDDAHAYALLHLSITQSLPLFCQFVSPHRYYHLLIEITPAILDPHHGPIGPDIKLEQRVKLGRSVVATTQWFTRRRNRPSKYPKRRNSKMCTHDWIYYRCKLKYKMSNDPNAYEESCPHYTQAQPHSSGYIRRCEDVRRDGSCPRGIESAALFEQSMYECA